MLRRRRRPQLRKGYEEGTNDELNLVLAQEDGSPVRSDTVTRPFAELSKAVGTYSHVIPERTATRVARLIVGDLPS